MSGRGFLNNFLNRLNQKLQLEYVFSVQLLVIQ